MPKLRIYPNNEVYFVPDVGAIIYPSNEPEEIVDLEGLSGDDILKLRKNPRDKKITDKARKNNSPR